MANKEIKALIKELEAQGFTVERTKSGHYIARKDGRRIANFGSTPSEYRAWKNNLAALRRAGFIWKR